MPLTKKPPRPIKTGLELPLHSELYSAVNHAARPHHVSVCMERFSICNSVVLSEQQYKQFYAFSPSHTWSLFFIFVFSLQISAQTTWTEPLRLSGPISSTFRLSASVIFGDFDAASYHTMSHQKHHLNGNTLQLTTYIYWITWICKVTSNYQVKVAEMSYCRKWKHSSKEP